MDSFQQRIRAIRSDLSPSFERLADFLLDSYMKAAFFTATELAHNLDVDPATVVRFAQKLGYSGYPALQKEIRRKVKDELFLEPASDANSPSEAARHSFQRLADYLLQTRRSFPVADAEALITVLDVVDRVVILADGDAQPAAHAIGEFLEAAGYTIHIARGSVYRFATALASLHKNDLVIAIDVTGEHPFLETALSEAAACGAQTAAIVAEPSSPAARPAKIVLHAHASDDPGMRMLLVQSLIYALIQMLRQARPARFEQAAKRVRSYQARLLQG